MRRSYEIICGTDSDDQPAALAASLALDLEAQLGRAALTGPRVCVRLARQPAQRLTQSPRPRVARMLIKRIIEIGRAQRQLLAELTSLIDAHAPDLLAQPGCGTMTAAIMVWRQ